MNIIFDKDKKIFHLTNKKVSYVMQVINDGYLVHLYWGKAVNEYRQSNKILHYDRGFSPNPNKYMMNPEFSLDTIPMEYTSFGIGDFRIPSYQIEQKNGSRITDLRYFNHRIFKGKNKLEGLPSTWINNENEAMTLEIIMKDDIAHLEAVFSYTIFSDYNVICRNVRFKNLGNEILKINKALSMSIDFRESNFESITLFGGHINEKNIERKSLIHGIQTINSVRGMSSHQQSPFIALVRKDTNEYSGEVYGFNLIYSGNFEINTEIDQFNCTRLNMGINSFDFLWLLKSNEEFQTPEAVLTYNENGLCEMSKTFYNLYLNNLSKSKFTLKERPILINNWEATYFDFNEEKIIEIARKGKELGMELFVLDDGWFGKRNNDDSSLGDWFVNKEKLPSGIDGISKRINDIGIKFGIWLEPEMISVNSLLYKEHPDWCIHIENREYTFGRKQLVLDLSREEVRDYIVEAVSKVLKNSNK